MGIPFFGCPSKVFLPFLLNQFPVISLIREHTAIQTGRYLSAICNCRFTFKKKILKIFKCSLPFLPASLHSSSDICFPHMQLLCLVPFSAVQKVTQNCTKKLNISSLWVIRIEEGIEEAIGGLLCGFGRWVTILIFLTDGRYLFQ